MWRYFLLVLAVASVAFAAGLGAISFWWVLPPALLAGLHALAKGPHRRVVLQADNPRRLWLTPLFVALYSTHYLIGAAVIYWLTGLVWG